MSRRLKPTLTDYVVIAINPVLIMGLVGSLVYFLLELFYAGQYPDKLRFCLSCFVFAIVLISRIAMEQGTAHAVPFGAALAVLVGIAMNRFVDYHGAAIGNFGWLINWGLMALTWWCAHQLVWDCTAIDESEEAAGRGLLETAGIDRVSGEPVDERRDEQPESPQPEEKQPLLPAPGELRATHWRQLIDRPKQAHTPGVWVVYFSLAALPIFGLGQAFIPADRTASRRYAFVLLCVYVGCGLALLMTTSFLSLRRYLRQKALEMPLAMVGNWLLTGGAMIAAILLVAALLPRPAPEFAISALPTLGSSEHEASSVSVGREGVRDPNAAPDSGLDHSQDPATDQPQQSGGADTRAGTGPSGAQSGQPGNSSSSSSQQGAASGQGSSSGSTASSQSNQPTGGEKSSDKSSSTDQQTTANASSQGEQNGEKQPGERSQPEPNSGQSSPSNTAEPPAPPQTSSATGTPPPPSPGFDVLGGALGELLKVVAYLVLIGLGAWGAWVHRHELLAMLRSLPQAWRDFWAWLLGRQPKAAAEPDDEPEPLEPSVLWSFAEFTDPFARGGAERYPPADVVKYTFAALEVWAREQGVPREPDQTPFEFAATLAGRIRDLPADVQTLASLYGRAVYSTSPLPLEHVRRLAGLWRFMQSTAARQAGAIG